MIRRRPQHRGRLLLIPPRYRPRRVPRPRLAAQFYRRSSGRTWILRSARRRQFHPLIVRGPCGGWPCGRHERVRPGAQHGGNPSGLNARRWEGFLNDHRRPVSRDSEYQVLSVSRTPCRVDPTHPTQRRERNQMSAAAQSAQTYPTPILRHRAAIIGGNRIPFARAGKEYAAASNQDLLTAALDGLIARFGLAGQELGEVVGGAVLKHSRDFNLTREAVLGSALSSHTPAYDLQQACATSLQATVAIANKIQLGQLESGIAAGVDSTSDAPIAVSEGLRKALLKLSRARTVKQKLAALAAIRPRDLSPDAPRTDEPRTGLSMGEHQALTTAFWDISRTAQDEIALASHQNLARAYDENFFDDLMTPYRGLTRDGNLRADTSLEKLGQLEIGRAHV